MKNSRCSLAKRLEPQILCVSRRPLLDVLVTLELEGRVEED